MWLFSLNDTALTVNNIIEAIQGLDWRKFGRTLYIPDSKLDEISQEYVTDKQRETAVVRYWLLRDPLASWRRIIHELYLDDEEEQADRIHHYAEELTGMYTTGGLLHMDAWDYRIRSSYACYHYDIQLVKGFNHMKGMAWIAHAQGEETPCPASF